MYCVAVRCSIQKSSISIYHIYFAYSLDRHSCYMVRADELYTEVSHDSSGKTPSQGLFIGCFIDTSTGVVSFTCEGKETKQKFKMEPGMKLFPAIFFKVRTVKIICWEKVAQNLSF